MACRVPKCDTWYWNKSAKGITMFAVNTDKRIQDWTEILKRNCGLDRELDKKDRICILHFREDDIERERIDFLGKGKVSKVHREVPILSPYANSRMLLEKGAKSRHKKSKKKAIDCSVLLGSEVVEEQSRVVKAAEHSIDSEKKVKKRVQLVKRHLGDAGANSIKTDDRLYASAIKSGRYWHIVAMKRKLDADIVPLEGVISKRIPKLHDIKLNEEVVNAIHEKRIISKYLNKCWIPNLHNNDEEFASWTLWKEDCSGCLKCIILHKNLKVDVYLQDKSMSFPEMYNIRSMCDFEQLAKKVTQIKSYMRAQGDLGESDCLAS